MSGFGFGFGFSPLGALLNQNSQVITDAMLTEEGTFYMMSEDEPNVYLQLTEVPITDAMLTEEGGFYMTSENELTVYLQLT